MHTNRQPTDAQGRPAAYFVRKNFEPSIEPSTILCARRRFDEQPPACDVDGTPMYMWAKFRYRVANNDPDGPPSWRFLEVYPFAVQKYAVTIPNGVQPG